MGRTSETVLASEEERKKQRFLYMKEYRKTDIYKKNKRAYMKEYRKDPKRKTAQNKYMKIWRSNNKNTLKKYFASAANKLRKKEYSQLPAVKKRMQATRKIYRQTTDYKIAAIHYKHKRRTQMKNTDITSSWLFVFSKNTTRCGICSLPLGEKRHLDHIIPLNPKCNGTHTMKNVRYVHGSCNLHRPKDGSDVKLLYA